MATGNVLARVPADVGRDVRYALRRLIKSPGFAAVGIISLALGIGLCSLVFAQVNGLILRPLPGAADPDALVGLQTPVSYPYFETYRGHDEVAAAAAAFIGPVPFGIAVEGGASEAERVFGHLVSPGYFITLGVRPSAGRVFGPETEKPGSEPVVVVSERFWRTRLDADPDAVGRTLRVNGHTATIVGIGPTDFLGVYPFTPADIFVPVTVGDSVSPELRDDVLNDPELARFQVVLRLASGVTMSAAEVALDVVTRNLDQERPDPERDREGQRVSLLSAGATLPMTPEQRMLQVGSNFVLLGMVLSLVCGNLATLLLARASERRREIAIRLSLGASRFRLVRQLLTESVLIAIAGGIAGLLFAYWLAIVSVLAGVGFGLAPAIVTARANIVGALKGSGAPQRRYRRVGLRNLLVVYQVAGSLMLLLVTGYIVVGYQRSAGVDPGFETADLQLFSVDPPRDGYSVERSTALLDTLLQRVPEMTEVDSMTTADRAPFASPSVVPNARVSIEAGDGVQNFHSVLRLRIGSNYFETLDVPILRGREFDTRDQLSTRSESTQARETPVIVNQTAASLLFADRNPLGQRIRQTDQSYVVVGISEDLKSAFLNAATVPTVFLPLTAESFAQSRPQGTTVVLRSRQGVDPIAAVRREVGVLEPDLTIFGARTMDDHVDQFNGYIRLTSVLNGGIGVFALILAAIGLAGVTTHAVARRRKEIGLRIALGARRSQVLQLVLKEGVVLVAVGSVLGFLGAFAFSRVFAALTAEFAQILAMGTGDPLLLIGAPLLLVTLALLACYLPARRATQVDPFLALKED
jgi:ABC-type antimicrobial peptide transport system permease subunit